MAENLEKQTQQYQKRFEEFINEIDDGTFDDELNKMVEGHSQIPPVLQKNINEQIQAYQSQSPNSSVAGFVNFLGKSVANSFLGPVGLSVQDFQNPQRIAEKAKGAAIRGVSSAITQTIPSPNSIINRIKNGDRDAETKQERLERQKIYEANQSVRKYLSDQESAERGEPTAYEEKMKEDFPESFKRMNVIQNNSGGNFYTSYKVLHEEGDTEISDAMSNYLIKFHVTNSDDVLIFRMANFTGLTDSVSVSYNDVRYFGRPESLKQYDSVSRNVAFSFDVIVDNQSDIDPIYRKLDILMGLCYPNSYTNDNIIQPNIIKLSLGKYIKRMPFFVTSLSYTPDDELVFSEGKPRAVTVNVTGDIIQPESNPETHFAIPSFVNNLTEDEKESMIDDDAELPATTVSDIGSNSETSNTSGITGVPDF